MKPEYTALIKRLEDLPKLIGHKKREILTNKSKLQDSIYWYNKRIAQIKYEVAIEKGSDGKKKYTNDAIRDREIITRKTTNPEYKDARDQKEIFDINKETLEIELSQLRYEFRSIEATVEIMKLGNKVL